LGLSGRVPSRVDAATKAGLLDLVDRALTEGWTVRATCRVLELGELRCYRWLGRRAADALADQAPGGSPMHGLPPGAQRLRRQHHAFEFDGGCGPP
jgi:putative transposase